MTELTQQVVKELLDYDPTSGKLTWKERDAKWFKTNRSFSTWNSRFANKEAFTSIHSNGYKQGTLFGWRYLSHQIIWLWMTGEFIDQIDPKDRNGINNVWLNLRPSDSFGNNRNQSISKNNDSGYKGVQWLSRINKWTARITVNYKGIYLGSFNKKEDAALAYNFAALKYFGQFAFFK